MKYLFQSTPSGGKATSITSIMAVRLWFQSTPSGGKATLRAYATLPIAKFQSTPSGGKATPVYTITYTFQDVSIHAFRGEGDRYVSTYR